MSGTFSTNPSLQIPNKAEIGSVLTDYARNPRLGMTHYIDKIVTLFERRNALVPTPPPPTIQPTPLERIAAALEKLAAPKPSEQFSEDSPLIYVNDDSHWWAKESCKPTRCTACGALSRSIMGARVCDRLNVAAHPTPGRQQISLVELNAEAINRADSTHAMVAAGHSVGDLAYCGQCNASSLDMDKLVIECPDYKENP